MTSELDAGSLGTVETETAFLERTYRELSALGFRAENTIACVAVCRDELCRSLRLAVQQTWGEAFDFAALAGVPTLGRTGVHAAFAHAPIEGGRERYVVFGMPHVGVGADGALGTVTRRGRPHASTACGALCGLLSELRAGTFDTTFDPADPEMSLLRARLGGQVLEPASIDLEALTRLARDTIVADLESLIDGEVDSKRADWAVLTGVQIHGPGGEDLVAAGVCYAVIEGKRVELGA